MKLKIILAIFLASNLFAFSQKKDDSDTKEKKSFWKTIYGVAPESSIIFMPIAHHFIDPDTIFPLYTGVNYKSYELSVYRNSQNNTTYSLLFKRKLNLSENLSFIGGAGIMYGYHGKLQYVRGVPFKKTLFSGKINPVVGLEFNYKLSKKISINTSIIPPVVIAYGLRYAL